MTAPRVGIALGGGGARGLAHICVLEVLDEFGLTPTIVAGSSIGSFVGAGYASGMTGTDIRAHATEIFGDSARLMSKLWAFRPKTLAELRTGMSQFSIQANAEQIVSMFLPDTVPQTIDEFPVPFLSVASDYYGWNAVEFTSGPVRPAIAASIAIPAIFKPVLIGDRVMIDVNAANPLPFDLIRSHCDISIAVDVISGPQGDPATLPKVGDVAFGATQLMMQTIVREKLRHAAPDILLRPNIEIFGVFDFLKIRAILKVAEPIKDELRRKLEAQLTAFTKGHAPTPL